jgi:hypothetical protein
MNWFNFYIKLTVFMLSASYCTASNTATTFDLEWGRLGDHLLDYTHNKWIFYQTGVPFILQPFPYSDHFVFHYEEPKLTSEKHASFKHRYNVGSLFEVTLENEDTLYVIGHCPDSYDEYKFLGWCCSPYVAVDWSDTVFRDEMRRLISPIHPLELLKIPEKIITVALHFRTGVGYDADVTRRSLPLRFPEPIYYIEQLNQLYSLVNQEPLYVYIFTDHPNPEELLQMLREKFPQENIQFDCRLSHNHHNANVLEDLFSMMQFDCLIRAVSHYSIVASHLGDFKIEMFPKNGYWENDKFVISQVGITQKGSWDPNSKEWNMEQ